MGFPQLLPNWFHFFLEALSLELYDIIFNCSGKVRIYFFSTPLYRVGALCVWIHKVLRFQEYVGFGPCFLLCRTQAACFAKSKCSLSHMLLTPDVAWLGTWQVGRGVVSILKWVGTASQLDRTKAASK